MNKGKKDIFKGFLVFVFVVALLFLYNKIIVQKKYKEKSRFTIGVINDFNSAKGGAYVVKFSYEINNKKYAEFYTVENKMTKKDIGKRFLVVYVYGEEEMSYIDIKSPIPDSILLPPSDGWNRRPIWAK